MPPVEDACIPSADFARHDRLEKELFLRAAHAAENPLAAGWAASRSLPSAPAMTSQCSWLIAANEIHTIRNCRGFFPKILEISFRDRVAPYSKVCRHQIYMYINRPHDHRGRCCRQPSATPVLDFTIIWARYLCLPHPR